MQVSERFGSPATRRRSLLANETTLFVLMLFNFSKPGVCTASSQPSQYTL